MGERPTPSLVGALALHVVNRVLRRRGCAGFEVGAVQPIRPASKSTAVEYPAFASGLSPAETPCPKSKAEVIGSTPRQRFVPPQGSPLRPRLDIHSIALLRYVGSHSTPTRYPSASLTRTTRGVPDPHRLRCGRRPRSGFADLGVHARNPDLGRGLLPGALERQEGRRARARRGCRRAGHGRREAHDR